MKKLVFAEVSLKGRCKLIAEAFLAPSSPAQPSPYFPLSTASSSEAMQTYKCSFYMVVRRLRRARSHLAQTEASLLCG